MKSLRNLKTILAVGVLALPGSLFAQEPSFISNARIRPTSLNNADASGSYISAFGGVTLLQDESGFNGDLDSEIGAMVGGKIGYDIDSKQLPALWGGNVGITTAVEMESFYLDNSEDIDLESIFFGLNGIVRFDLFNNFIEPYVGAGIGGVYSELGDDDDVLLAWQLLDGVQLDVGKGFALFVEHKWLSIMDGNFTSGGTTTSWDWLHQHTVAGGLKYKF
ncbi:MAG: outer membrane beta-barrel protein [Verrucomicrobiota bacterium]